MIPHTVPADTLWPPVRPGRFAASIEHVFSAGPAPRSHPLTVALLGIPDDTGVQMNAGRTGAAAGPAAFRAALAKYGVATPTVADTPSNGTRAASPPPRRPLQLPRVVDAGDIVPADSLTRTHARVRDTSLLLAERGYIPFAVGGGHDLTLPFVCGVIRATCPRPDGTAPTSFSNPVSTPPAPFHGFYLDAHLDVRAEPGSGMPFRGLIEHCSVSSLHCVGFDPFANSAEHVEWFINHGGTIHEARDAMNALTLFAAKRVPTFLSIDMDGIDSGTAPGVSAVNPCGLSPSIACDFARAAGRNPAVRCADIMELNPSFDADGRTARLAARLFLEFLAGVAERPV